ncbi:MAG: 50S ribosomal protein L29 [Fimbriimonadaceae bacterium]
MKAIKAADLRSKSIEELESMVAEERASLYQARRDFVFRQTTDTAGKQTRRQNIARIMTVITEKQKEGANG